jgi:hypothetical protein
MGGLEEPAMTQRMRLVPEVATEEMCHALAGDCDWNAVKGGFQADYEQMIAASPTGGSVTAAMLERAAAGLLSDWESDGGTGEAFGFDWAMKVIQSDDPDLQVTRLEFLRMARAALLALGLVLASEPPPAATEEGR